MKQITALKSLITPLLLFSIAFVMPFTAYKETIPHIQIGFNKETRNVIAVSVSITFLMFYLLLSLVSLFSKRLNKKSNCSILSIIFLIIAFAASAPYVFTFDSVVGTKEFKVNLILIISTSMLIVFDVSLSISLFTITNLSLKMQSLKLSRVSSETGEITDEYFVGGAFNDYSGLNSLELKTKVNKMQEGLKKSTSAIINEIEKTGEFAGIILAKEQKPN